MRPKSAEPHESVLAGTSLPQHTPDQRGAGWPAANLVVRAFFPSLRLPSTAPCAGTAREGGQARSRCTLNSKSAAASGYSPIR